MAGQSITFDFLSRGAATLARDFRSVGDESALSSRGVKILSDVIEKLGAKEDRTAAESALLARALRQTGDAADRVTAKAVLADAAIRKIGDEAAKAAAKTEAAKAGFSGLAGLGGIPGGGMGAVIAAGVALAPVLVTVGVGTAGFAAAAAGAIKPIETAAQKTGGLAANMHLLNPEQQRLATSILGLGKQYDAFQKALQPQVLGVFNTGLRLAGHLMGDVQPVAAATGKAFDVLLGRIDKEFQSRTWQDFFGFMAKTAGPDVQLLGNLFIALANDLPPLLIQLQPLATGLLNDAAAVLKLVNAGTQLVAWEHAHATAVSENTGLLGRFGHAAEQAFNQLFPGVKAAKLLQDGLDKMGASSDSAGGKVKGLGGSAAAAAARVQSLQQQVSNLSDAENKALTPLLAYTNAMITQRNDAVILTAALKASGGAVGLQTAAQRASFSAANTYIQDLLNTSAAAVKSHQGIDAQITSLRTALPILQSVRGGTKQYWQEVQVLTDTLKKLEAIKAITKVIKMQGDGTFKITDLTGQGLGVQGPPPGVKKAAGGLITAGTGPTADDVAILVSRGELIVPAHMVRAGAVDHLRGKLPGFASGGIAGNLTPAFISGMLPEFTRAMTAAMVTVMRAAMKAAISAASAAASSGGVSGAGPVGGDAAANKALARRMFPWPASMWPSYDYLEMREAGYNRFARNPSSGAYGIPQALPPTKMPFAAQAAGGSHAGPQISWMYSYISGRYGNPVNAAAHERAFNWYGGGLDAVIGRPTLIGVGERGPEHVTVTPGGGGDLGAKLDRLSGQVAELIRTTAAVPAATGRHVAAGVNGAAADAVWRGRYPGR